MQQKILVTYASRAGSTTGVVEAVCQTLAGTGAQVEICPMNFMLFDFVAKSI